MTCRTCLGAEHEGEPWLTLFDRRGESTLRAVCFATRSLRIPVIMETIAGIRKGRFVSDGGVKGGDPACNPSRRAPTPNPNPTVASRPQTACIATGPSYNQSIKVCSSSDTNEVRAPPPAQTRGGGGSISRTLLRDSREEVISIPAARAPTAASSRLVWRGLRPPAAGGGRQGQVRQHRPRGARCQAATGTRTSTAELLCSRPLSRPELRQALHS